MQFQFLEGSGSAKFGRDSRIDLNFKSSLPLPHDGQDCTTIVLVGPRNVVVHACIRTRYRHLSPQFHGHCIMACHGWVGHPQIEAWSHLSLHLSRFCYILSNSFTTRPKHEHIFKRLKYKHNSIQWIKKWVYCILFFGRVYVMICTGHAVGN
jgi:hypothetical protein